MLNAVQKQNKGAIQVNDSLNISKENNFLFLLLFLLLFLFL